MGLDALPVHLRWEAIRRGGYALALCDYDQDGFVDMYVGTGKEGVLLRNEGNVRFEDATAEAGLEADKLVKSAVFADFDNDGTSDLLLVKFEYSSDRQAVLYGGLGGGKFRKASNFDFARLGNYDRHARYPMPMAVGDFNRDSLLDLYVGFPGK
ncbi:MAG: ASPIC/UnbV domain-containing protein, partial [Elusimicrobia bacterium]